MLPKLIQRNPSLVGVQGKKNTKPNPQPIGSSHSETSCSILLPPPCPFFCPQIYLQDVLSRVHSVLISESSSVSVGGVTLYLALYLPSRVLKGSDRSVASLQASKQAEEEL